MAKGYNKGLEYALKGTKFPIEIKLFGNDPPIEENVKYCDKCGKLNRKTAKYCAKCRNEFWI